MTKPQINIIAAMSSNRVIGKDGKLPWHIGHDLRRFKALTMGHPIVMGRKTFESIGKPLKGRRNIVLTRYNTYEQQGIEIANSIQAALDLCNWERKIFFIGGEEVYKQALPITDKIHLTIVHKNFDGDAYFPDFSKMGFFESEHRQDYSWPLLCSCPLRYSFLTFSKKPNFIPTPQRPKVKETK
jgi:dihydrofolate reductase